MSNINKSTNETGKPRRDFLKKLGPAIGLVLAGGYAVSINNSESSINDNNSDTLVNNIPTISSHSNSSELSSEQQLIEIFENLGLNHPLTSNIFARHEGNKSRVDNIIHNHALVEPIIQQYGPELKLIPGSEQNYAMGRALLESGRRPKIVANAKSKNYNAAGLYQYIPDTWRQWFNKSKKQYPSITNDRTNAISNALVTRVNFEASKEMCDDAGFALWGHHAGIERITGCNHTNQIHGHQGYLNMYEQLTDSKPVSMMDRYNQILPWEMVDKFGTLRDNSFIYVAQVFGVQQVDNLIKLDPSKVQATVESYKNHQRTKTRGAAIDDINYPHISTLNNIAIPNRDPTLEQLLISIADITNQPLQIVDPQDHIVERAQDKLAVSAILAGKGAKIQVPFGSSESLRASQSQVGLRYKRVRYLLEMARIHGLCSLSSERLPSGQLVYHVGLMPHVIMDDIYRFAQLDNHNIKKPAINAGE